MPTVNERCKILRSLNRVYVFEIVLLLVPRLKILRRRGLSYFGIFEKQRGTVEFPRNKPQQVGDGRTIHSLGGVDATICLGDETVTQHCRVLDTDAFDIVN